MTILLGELLIVTALDMARNGCESHGESLHSAFGVRNRYL